MKIPKKLGERIDLLYRLQQDREAKQHTMEVMIAELKKDEQKVEDSIINEFTAEQISKVGGTIAAATVSLHVYPQVKDWPAFYAYIKKTDSFDLLERRPTRVAYRERVENGEKIPGVESFTKKVLSLRKLNTK